MRIVVVGAGLGGLCVAHGLLKAGADVEVLEARDAIRDRHQGYRININQTGHEALRACLPAGLFTEYELTLHRQPDSAKYLYSPGLDLLSRTVVPPAPGAIDRGTMLRLLARDLRDRIHLGRRIASIADAGAADLIVAADGVASALRRELIPHAEPEPLGWSAIFGRGPLPDSTDPAIQQSRFYAVVDSDTVLALCAYNRADPYLMWVLMGPSAELPGHGTPALELVRFARERTAGWNPRATAALRTARSEESFLTPLRSMTEIPDPPIRSGTPVAFLGDAIHAMSPAGGEGANTALGDAALLMAHLQEGNKVSDTVARYHATMRVTAGAALRRSARYQPQGAR
jgi:2-polyprenyl-6-methoxyphenol hydroxylase-like FAD-dependent oxidoreductase